MGLTHLETNSLPSRPVAGKMAYLLKVFAMQASVSFLGPIVEAENQTVK